jgi:hypothetical protein
MRRTFWRQTGLLTLLWLLVIAGPTVHAAALPSGIHGMAWGGHVDNYPHLAKVRAAGDASYYVDRKMVYRTAGQPVSAVIYGFYRDQLFAAYIKLRSPNQAYYLEKHFSAEYGPAKVTTADGGGQTVYRWEEGDLKVKLKIQDAVNVIKLGIYYQPLANKLNQALAEEGPVDAFTPSQTEDQGAESAPLL